ncbi:hypothetical protein ACHAXR_006658 [Thalassiosira sp. AJA248-18]
MRSNLDKRTRSIRLMTGSSSSSGGGRSAGIHIASGEITDDRQGGEMAITRSPPDDVEENKINSYMPSDDDPYGGIEEEAIMFPQSTHSWLFTENVDSLPFCFAVAIVTLSYFCLILALINIFEDYEPENPFSVPYQVKTSVRISQYLAMIIALIMEEEIPTGLYLLRMISKESLNNKFPTILFVKFVLAAIVRLVMVSTICELLIICAKRMPLIHSSSNFKGYLFLFNTFVVVAQATAVLDIFYDVLALQFLQQLDDIAFNLSKIDVFGKRLKYAALSKCFRAEFDKQPFALRKRMNKFLKGAYFLNFCALVIGMVWVTVKQKQGAFYADSITVTFGDQVWNDAIVTWDTGAVETRILLFSYFNGVYRYNGTQHDGRPVYTEQNKLDNSLFIDTVAAEVKYCKDEKAWVFAHRQIMKSDSDVESECPWLLRSPETDEYTMAQLTATIMALVKTESANVQRMGSDYFGTHCEHKKPCSLITGGSGGTWSNFMWPGEDVMRVYQSPIYMYERGLPEEMFEAEGLNSFEDQLYLIYTGSRWLGTAYPGVRMARRPKDWWKAYMIDFHAFWRNTYTQQTKFASDPTTQTSIIGVDFYKLGKQGEEFGPWGQLFPLSDPKGSGFMRCIENESETFSWDVVFVDQAVDFSDDSVGSIVVDYEIKINREWESDLLAKDCANPITNINHHASSVRSPKYDTHDFLSLKYSLDKPQLGGSNIYNATTAKMELCHVIRLIIPADYSIPKKVIIEKFNLISIDDAAAASFPTDQVHEIPHA